MGVQIRGASVKLFTSGRVWSSNFSLGGLLDLLFKICGSVLYLNNLNIIFFIATEINIPDIFLLLKMENNTSRIILIFLKHKIILLFNFQIRGGLNLLTV